MLQTRIILLVLLTVAAVSALLLAFADLRESAVERRARDLELARLQTAWDLAVAETAGRVDSALGRVAGDAGVVRQVADGDRMGLAIAALRIAGTLGSGVVEANLLAANGDLLLATGADPSFDQQPLLGGARLARLMAGEGPVRGTRAAGDRLLVVAGTPLYDGPEPVGAAVAAVPLDEALEALERLLGERVFALGRGGDAVRGAGDPLWAAVAARVDSGRDVTAVVHGGRHYALAGIPVADLAGGRMATVFVASDVTRAAGELRLWNLAYAGAIAAVLAAALGLLFVFLRRSFATLDAAVGALQTLSGGQTATYVELPAGNDEIGRIAGAVEVFREVMRDIERSAGQRERRLRRQQRFIRKQMEALATTLEEDARQALLDELAHIEQEARDGQSAQSKGVSDELGLLALGFSRLATRVSLQQVQLVQHVRDLREALEDKRRLISLQQELEIARTMQLSILPQSFPEMAELELAARMVPAKEVGGDFYDVFPVGERKLGIAVADVSGKGIPAAFFMLITRTMLRAIAVDGHGPAETLTRLNNLLSAENEQMMFVTTLYGEIDLDTGVFTYCNAGHNPPYRVDPAGTVRALEKTPGLALAVMGDMDFGQKSLTLTPGEVVLLYTDGVSEAFDPHGAMFGDERVVSTLAAAPIETARTGLDRIMDAVAGFSAEAPQSDDITCVVVHWHGTAAGAAAAAMAAGEA
ncbi:SpoIIE family protein phosphatase [Azospirillum halopraeferens]|uniref:SpoIIE family protein phosphatase n=1 Tax=Azospirillum halopraeferens TaxID=34010 RepID=UPI0003F86BDF|nr:SpoIIE family protein phosphatase [Azospirillum halopraeferens]